MFKILQELPKYDTDTQSEKITVIDLLDKGLPQTSNFKKKQTASVSVIQQSTIK